MNSIVPATSLHTRKAPKCKANFNAAASLWVAIVLVLLALAPARAEIQQQQQSDPSTQPQNTAPPTQTTSLPNSQSQGAAPLRVMVGKSLLINTTERLKRISVTDPSVAFATVITPTQILVHGRTPGEVSLLIW